MIVVVAVVVLGLVLVASLWLDRKRRASGTETTHHGSAPSSQHRSHRGGPWIPPSGGMGGPVGGGGP